MSRAADWFKSKRGTDIAPATPPAQDGAANNTQTVVDITEHGKFLAGRVLGGIEGLQTAIARIYRGHLVVVGTVGNPQYSMIGPQWKRLTNRLQELKKSIDARQILHDDAEKDHHLKLKQWLAAQESQHAPSAKIELVFANILVFFVGLYLYFFYFNVGYNAILASPLKASGIATGRDLMATAIFAPSAFGEASQAGGAFVALLLLPFVFIAFGFGAHVLVNLKNWAGLAMVLGLTLAFDTLLALEIVKKIHEAEFLLGNVTVHWHNGLAFSNITFYLIIFMGFLVYLIWGLLLRYALTTWDKLKHDASRLDKLLADQKVIIKDLSDVLDREKKKLNEMEIEEAQIRGLLGNFVQLVEGFMEGWLHWIAFYYSNPKVKQEKHKEAVKTKDEAISKLLHETYADDLFSNVVLHGTPLAGGGDSSA